MNFNVKTIAEFESSFKKLLKKYPSLKNDFYKIRISTVGKGKEKSGGGRIITCVKIVQHTVYLAAIYDKSVKSTLSDTELKLLATKIG